MIRLKGARSTTTGAQTTACLPEELYARVSADSQGLMAPHPNAPKSILANANISISGLVDRVRITYIQKKDGGVFVTTDSELEAKGRDGKEPGYERVFRMSAELVNSLVRDFTAGYIPYRASYLDDQFVMQVEDYGDGTSRQNSKLGITELHDSAFDGSSVIKGSVAVVTPFGTIRSIKIAGNEVETADGKSAIFEVLNPTFYRRAGSTPKHAVELKKVGVRLAPELRKFVARWAHVNFESVQDTATVIDAIAAGESTTDDGLAHDLGIT